MRDGTPPSSLVAATRLRFEGGRSKPRPPPRSYHLTPDANHNSTFPGGYEPSSQAIADAALKYLSADHDLDAAPEYRADDGDSPTTDSRVDDATLDGSSSGGGTVVKAATAATDANGTIRSAGSSSADRAGLSYRQRWDRSRTHRAYAAAASPPPPMTYPKVACASSHPTLNLADPARSPYSALSCDSNLSVFSLPPAFDLQKVVGASGGGGGGGGGGAFHSTPRVWDGSAGRSPVRGPSSATGEARPASSSSPPPSSPREAVAGLVLLSVLAVILAAVALQLLLRVAVVADAAVVVRRTVAFHRSLREVCAAVLSVVLLLCGSCLMVCSLQAVCALKLARRADGHHGVTLYLQDCAASRFIAVTSFFLSIPIFFLALLLYVLVEFEATTAIICTVVMAIGIVFTLTVALHNLYCWRSATTRSEWNNAGGGGGDAKKGSDMNQSELSTLV